MNAPSRSLAATSTCSDLVLDDFAHQAGGDLAALRNHGLARLVVDGVGQLQADEILVDLPHDFAVFDVDLADPVKRLQDLLVGFEPERAQKNGTVKFALTVDTYIKKVLVVVLELDPAAPVRNDLAEIVALGRDALEEHARRTMQLADNHAFGAVDDERAVVRHQRNFAEEDFLFLDVPDALGAGFRVFRVDREADGDLERRGISHATLFALGLIVFQLQAHRVAALVAEGDDIAVEGAAMMAENVAGVERISLNGRAAGRVPAGRPEVVQTLQIAALAFPVADRIVDKLKLTDAAEIGNREDGGKYRLQSDIVTLVRQKIHLQELFVRIFLDFDQIRNRNRSFDLGKINSIGGQTVLRHRIQELRYYRQRHVLTNTRTHYLEHENAANKNEGEPLSLPLKRSQLAKNLAPLTRSRRSASDTRAVPGWSEKRTSVERIHAWHLRKGAHCPHAKVWTICETRSSK